jgi:polar amino acid transport system substrate-binding protein
MRFDYRDFDRMGEGRLVKSDSRRARRWPCLVLVGLGAIVAAGSRLHADTLGEIQRRGALRWGGDEEGGGPYIYRPEDNPQLLTGFEVDLMNLLAQTMGVRSEFHSSNWPELLNTLKTGSIDVVVNGYELSPARLQNHLCTIPYYLYELHLFGRADDGRLSDWASIRQPRSDGGKWRIGVLKNTLADDYVSEVTASVDVRRYEGTTDAFRDVESRTLDATVTDTPAAVFYGPKFQVKQVGGPVARGYYVMYLRSEDAALRDALNAGLRGAIQDGKLRAIYEKFGLWNANQASLADAAVQNESQKQRPQGSGLGHWQIVARQLPMLLDAAFMTVKLSVAAMPLAIILGLLIALGRLYGPMILRVPLAMYVELVRGTPLLLQLYVLHFGIIPHLGLPDSVRTYTAIISAITALALNYAAYESEIYRAGLLAIPVGQMEAALALGLSRRQALWHVVIPQAVRLVIPPVTNDFINLFKDTSICSVIAVEELSKRYNIAVNASPQAFAELGLTAAALYLLMSFPLALVSRWLEKRQRTIHI